MKHIAFILILLSTLCFGCGEKNMNNDNNPLQCGCEEENMNNDDPIQSLEGTRWKLVGIVDAKTCVLQILEPKDCDECYTLTFDTDTTYSTWSSFDHTGTYQVDYATCGIRIISFGGPELPEKSKNGELYCMIFVSVQSFSLQKNELRLYYNDKKNYLLFKSQES